MKNALRGDVIIYKMSKSTECYPFFVQKIHPNAEHPYKDDSSDVGWNVTLIGRTDNRAEDDNDEVNEFNTGIVVAPTEDYYLEIHADKDLHKHGYMLTNGVRIIQPSDRGELVIPLYKFSDVNDIELPFKAVQIIVRYKVPTRAHTSKSLLEIPSDFQSQGYNASPLYGDQNTNFSQPGSRTAQPKGRGRGGNFMF